MNYLLDTNIISELISKSPNQKVVDFILNIDNEKDFKNLEIQIVNPFNEWDDMYKLSYDNNSWLKIIVYMIKSNYV